MENLIQLSKVLEIMNTDNDKGKLKPFSIVVMPFDKNRKDRQPIFYDNVSLAGKLTKKYAVKKLNDEYEKAPDHFENLTRNIRTADGSIRKIHIRSIHIFNNQPVLW
jgi:hypothetical protein